MKNFKFFIFTLVLSCRYYSLAGSIPPHINSIAIPIVENQTSEFGISESVTENLLNIFSKENILKITNEEDANSILRGKIVRITDAPYTFTKEEAVTEYRFTVQMSLEWFDVKNEKNLLKEHLAAGELMVYLEI